MMSLRLALLIMALSTAHVVSAAPPDGPVLDLEGSETGDKPVDPKAKPKDDGSGRTSLLENLADKTSHMLSRTTLGGYGEFEFHKEQDRDSFFMSHRYVLFVHSQISDAISTSTEIEFEFGGSPSKRDGVQSTGEVLLEFSVVDVEFTEWLVFRGGVILVPFGAFNIRHDSPTRDLTERPKPLTTITPTTWFEAGVGFLGTIPLGETASMNYEIYVINGLDAKITEEFGMKAAMGSKGEDNNDDKAVVGRIAFSPMLGFEFGVSGYTGEYDDNDNRVNMVGGDLTFRHAWFELLAEYVHAFIDEGFVEGFSSGSDANTRTAVPTEMMGFYVQTNFHFTIPGLWDVLPGDLAYSTLTGVIRYSHTDTNVEETNRFDTQKLTFGLNYRPLEAYVFKTEVQLITHSEDGEERHLFSGNFDPSWKFVSSVAFLF